MEQILSALLASGPVAMVLGYCTWTLWSANRTERLEHAAALKFEADRHQAEEEKIRRELIDTLRSFTTAANKGEPHA